LKTISLSTSREKVIFRSLKTKIGIKLQKIFAYYPEGPIIALSFCRFRILILSGLGCKSKPVEVTNACVLRFFYGSKWIFKARKM